MQHQAIRSTVAEPAAALAAAVALPEPANGEAMELGVASIEWLRAGAPAAPHRGADCQLYFQVARTLVGAVGSKTFRLESGSWIVVVAGATQIDIAPGGLTLSLRFPLDLLSRRVARLLSSRAPIALPVCGAAKMCVELGRSGLSQPEPMNASVASAVGDSLIELAKLAIIAQLCERRVESIRETARARIQAFIQRNLVDPELTIERIAERMQCTKRYLHKVFSDDGQTLSQYIWAERLERCRAELCRADLADRSITEIAFSCGFSNAAHFSRSFRARFGEAPRLYRRAMQEG